MKHHLQHAPKVAIKADASGACAGEPGPVCTRRLPRQQPRRISSGARETARARGQRHKRSMGSVVGWAAKAPRQLESYDRKLGRAADAAAKCSTRAWASLSAPVSSQTLPSIQFHGSGADFDQIWPQPRNTWQIRAQIDRSWSLGRTWPTATKCKPKSTAASEHSSNIAPGGDLRDILG